MENGLVIVNAYAVVNGITYPLLFEPFKPNKRLRSGDPYRTKPELAVKLLEQVQAWGFRVGLVLADSLYGESGDVIRALEQRGLPFIVAIRSNHSVLMPQGAKKRYNRWAPYQQQLSRHHAEQRYIREIVFGQRRDVRYYQVSKRAVPDPEGGESWYLMTNLSGSIQQQVAPLYSLRNWIEYDFKQVKNELGWADFRLTAYESIERWWELVLSAYLLVSLQANYSKNTWIVNR